MERSALFQKREKSNRSHQHDISQLAHGHVGVGVIRITGRAHFPRRRGDSNAPPVRRTSATRPPRGSSLPTTSTKRCRNNNEGHSSQWFQTTNHVASLSSLSLFFSLHTFLADSLTVMKSHPRHPTQSSLETAIFDDWPRCGRQEGEREIPSAPPPQLPFHILAPRRDQVGRRTLSPQRWVRAQGGSTPRSIFSPTVSIKRRSHILKPLLPAR